jgi:hypothetical protein
MELETLSPSSHEECEAFLLASDGALLYHSRRYLGFLQELLGCSDRTLVAREDGRIVGVFPILALETERGTVLNSSPFYGSHGGVVTARADVEAALVEAYARLARTDGVLASTVVGNPFLARSEPAYPADLHDERIAQVTELPAADASDARSRILALAEPSAARNVKKAEKAGIVVERDPGALAGLRAIHEENMTRIGGRPKPGAFFDLVPRHFRAGEDYDLYVARKGGALAAALLVFYFRRTVEYFVPGIEHAYRSEEPLAAILATAMSDAAARGFRVWNWGGTWLSQTGVYRFKRKWGGVDSSYRYHVALNDRSLLATTAAELTQRFPGFYVVPFDRLRPAVT